MPLSATAAKKDALSAEPNITLKAPTTPPPELPPSAFLTTSCALSSLLGSPCSLFQDLQSEMRAIVSPLRVVEDGCIEEEEAAFFTIVATWSSPAMLGRKIKCSERNGQEVSDRRRRSARRVAWKQGELKTSAEHQNHIRIFENEDNWDSRSWTSWMYPAHCVGAKFFYCEVQVRASAIMV